MADGTSLLMTTLDIHSHSPSPLRRDLHHQEMGGKYPPCSDAGPQIDATTPDAPPLLNHAQYPHIMDDIIRFSAPAALLRLRSTSREYRDRVDGFFASHIVIANSTAPAHAGTMSSYLAVAPHLAPRFRPPLDLARARVVDLVGPVGARTVAYRCAAGKTGHELYLEYLASRLAHVQVVRLRCDGGGRAPSACPIRTRAVVAFTQFAEPDSSGSRAPAAVGPVADGVARLVLNVAFEPRAWWLPRATLAVADLAHHPSLRAVTVILSPRAASPGCARAYGEPADPQWMGMMCSVVNLLCHMLPRGVRFTLVGVDTLEPEWLGIEPDWHGSPPSAASSMFDCRNDTVVHLVQDAIAAELRRRNAWDFDEADEALARVRFVTRARYEREVTPRQFELETWE